MKGKERIAELKQQQSYVKDLMKQEQLWRKEELQGIRAESLRESQKIEANIELAQKSLLDMITQESQKTLDQEKKRLQERIATQKKLREFSLKNYNALVRECPEDTVSCKKQYEEVCGTSVKKEAEFQSQLDQLENQMNIYMNKWKEQIRLEREKVEIELKDINDRVSKKIDQMDN